MTAAFIVTGTDTGLGKTVFAAALAGALDGAYWKPIQAGGLDRETDRDVVRRLSGLPADRVLPEVYRLRTPASPHLAAEIDGVAIEIDRLAPPQKWPGSGSLIIEGAGGLLVPLSRRTLQIELFARWGLPVILCTRTALGTINHSLLSIEALRRRSIPIHGLAFIGEENAESERIITEMGGVRRLGRLPHLPVLDAATLRAAFTDNFRREDFT